MQYYFKNKNGVFERISTFSKFDRKFLKNLKQK
jgi:hypothetical protein